MSTPFGQQPTYDELVKMVTDLHDKVKAPLTLDDLPLRDLRSKLIDNGEPLDLSVLALTSPYLPVVSVSIAAADTITSATYAALPTATSVTIPVTGNYEIGFLCGRVDCAAPDGVGQVLVSLSIGGVAAIDANSAGWRSINFNPGGRVQRFNALTAGTVIALHAKQTNGNGRVFERDLWARQVL